MCIVGYGHALILLGFVIAFGNLSVADKAGLGATLHSTSFRQGAFDPKQCRHLFKRTSSCLHFTTVSMNGQIKITGDHLPMAKRTKINAITHMPEYMMYSPHPIALAIGGLT